MGRAPNPLRRKKGKKKTGIGKGGKRGKGKKGGGM